MMSWRLDRIVYGLIVLAAAALAAAGSARADDTEIYQATGAASGARPQVLIIFDNSESMTTLVTGERAPYDPAETSYTYDGVNKHPGDRIYWSQTGRPPAANSVDYILTDANRCASSYTPLDNFGFYTSRAARWSPGGTVETCIGTYCFSDFESAGWYILQSAVNDVPHLECENDVIENNPLNGAGIASGYPQNSSADGEEYGPEPDSSLGWEGAYTFYSAHYMDWYHDSSVSGSRTRLEIAKEVISNLVAANTSIDFSLAMFNSNDPGDEGGENHGGRIVQGLVPDMSLGDRENLVALINGSAAETNTPLCETTMEVYRYLAGKGVVYGLERLPASPGRDIGAESPLGTYNPPAQPCANTYVILMTDGRPSFDQDANADIEALTSRTCRKYPSDDPGGQPTKNCLPELVEYMATNDINTAAEGDQLAQTYTIGFALGSGGDELLRDAARKGNGAYFSADGADGLAAAFSGALLDILSNDTTFTSPAVATDSFSRTSSRNEVFFAMFKPDNRVDWPGNIKRLDIDSSSGEAIFVDDDGVPAINTATGQIKTTATTVWSTGNDGPDVLKGGVGALLAARSPASRTLYSNTGAGEVLQPFGPANMTPSAFGFDTDAELYDLFEVRDEAEFDATLAWGAGYDVADEDGDGIVDEARPWILADMLHSKPLVVNYGARGDFTVDNPDLRIVVGTNAGFLHMFDNRDGEEDWAFFAKELGPVLNKRRVNALSSQHVYGIDAPIVLYTKDLDRDGTIDSAAGDRAHIYFGLRRGGRALYALDISNPDAPEFLWKIDYSQPGFRELGQTWSVPVVTRVAGYADEDGVSKPVLVFGAGYDENKDSAGVATPDAMGRGIFIVDAFTGALVWSMTPAGDSATNMQESGLLHSVAGNVTVLDSNGDSLTDRVYFADTGGQLWRLDMPGASLPDSDQDSWRAVRIAVVNGGTETTDRRFFNAPDVVRTSFQGVPFDAILIGTGDRTNPNDMDMVDSDGAEHLAVDNQFYMFRDLAINPYFSVAPTEAECSDDPPSVDFRCQLPLTPADLYDVTANEIQSIDPAVRSAAQLALAGADGWRLDLQANGEKSLSSSITIAGKVYFTTFAPGAGSGGICEPVAGEARLYAVNLASAASLEDDSTDRSWVIGTIPPDTLSVHVDDEGVVRLLLPLGSDGGGGSDPCQGGVCDPKYTYPPPYGSYWYQEEY